MVARAAARHGDPRGHPARPLLERSLSPPVYDHPQFLVRQHMAPLLWRWYDGELDNLPPPRAHSRHGVGGMAGGVTAVLERARALADAFASWRWFVIRRARRRRVRRCPGGPLPAGRGLRGAGRPSRRRRWHVTSSTTPRCRAVAVCATRELAGRVSRSRGRRPADLTPPNHGSPGKYIWKPPYPLSPARSP
ncbi:hypothetical protein HBB16_01000 [Pseudonocardia sp. MCCB 268]|nr:hypothetical protein [Pseudonocardia cytotoxica]